MNIQEMVSRRLINPVGFGGIPIQRLGMKDAIGLLHYAFSRGINLVDTARGYTDSEEKIGHALESFGPGVYTATKSMVRSYEDMKRDIEISLNKMKQDFIFLYQLHCVNSLQELKKITDMEKGALRALTEARKAGRVKHIGITGHIPGVLAEALMLGIFEAVQVPHNIIETECERVLIPLAVSMDIPVLAMKPAAGGALRRVALNLRYILSRGTSVALCGMDSKSQVDDNLSVLPDIEKPDEKEMSMLYEEKALWSGEFCRRCEYCMPCPQGLNIPFLLLLIAYWERYNLKEWVLERLEGQAKKFQDCTGCGECERKCAYGLNIIEMLRKGADIVRT